MASEPLLKATIKNNADESVGTLTAFWNKKKPNPNDFDDHNEHIETMQAPVNTANQDNSVGEMMNEEITPLPPVSVDASIPQQDNNAATEENVALVEEKHAAVEKDESNKAEKKRKRPAKTPEQVEALQSLFSSNPYPSTETKRECAQNLGLTIEEVNNWLEKRRKQARNKGELELKRARPSSSSAQPINNNNKEQAMPVDGTNPPSAQQGEQQQQGAEDQKINSPADAAVPIPMEVEEQQPLLNHQSTAVAAATTPSSPPAASLSAIPSSIPSPTTAQKQQPLSTQPQKSPSKSSKKTYSIPNQPERDQLLHQLQTEIDNLRGNGLAHPLVPLQQCNEHKKEDYSESRLAEYIVGQSMPLSLLVQALFAIFAAPEGSPPLTQEALRSRIIDLATRKSHDPEDALKGNIPLDTLEALPPSQRPSLWQWELRDTKTLPKSMRAQAALMKKRAARVGTRLSSVLNAYTALTDYANGKCTVAKTGKAIEGLSKTKPFGDIVGEFDGELNAALLKQPLNVLPSSSKAVENAAEKERLKLEKEAEKERLKMEKEAEKERLRMEKEAEKERLKMEKEAEKERLRMEKEAEKEKSRLEAEKQKLSKKTGFKSTATLNKTAHKFKSFFQGAQPTPPSLHAPSPSSPALAANPLSPQDTQQQHQHQQKNIPKTEYSRRFPHPSPNSQAPQPTFTPITANIDTALASAPTHDDIRGQWLDSLKSAARRRASDLETKSKTLVGLPPAWARRADALDSARQRYRQLEDGGVDPLCVQTWRRKFIWFPADSNRPAYHGSWSKPRGCPINSRRYLAKDPSLDYDVMSDLDWEEEPEGDSLSQADDLEESENGGDGEDMMAEDSFMVSDGHLSAEEGWKLDDNTMDDATTHHGDGVIGGGGGLNLASLLAAQGGGTAPHPGSDMVSGDKTVRELGIGMLKCQLDRARRCGKPLIVLRPDYMAHIDAMSAKETGNITGAAASDDRDIGNASAVKNGPMVSSQQHLVGDPALLEALRIEVITPGISFKTPEDPAALQASEHGDAAIRSAKKAGVGSGAAAPANAGAGAAPLSVAAGSAKHGRPKQERPDDLLPRLKEYLIANPASKKNDAVAWFMDAHPERSMSKKWVHDKITEMAEKKGTLWKMRVQQHAGVDGTPAARPAAIAATTTTTTAVNTNSKNMNNDGTPAQKHHMLSNQTTDKNKNNNNTGPLDQLLVKMSATTTTVATTTAAAPFVTMPTPAVPAALRPSEPLSSVKAPGRLMTTTFDGEKKKEGTVDGALQLPNQSILDAGTSSQYWYAVVRSIDDDNVAEYSKIFDAENVQKYATAMPAFVVSAVVAALQRNLESEENANKRIVRGIVRCMRSVVKGLVTSEEEKAQENEDASSGGNKGASLSISQHAWGEPVGPLAISLNELCSEPYLIKGLTRCMSDLCGDSDDATKAILSDMNGMLHALSKSGVALDAMHRQNEIGAKRAFLDALKGERATIDEAVIERLEKSIV